MKSQKTIEMKADEICETTLEDLVEILKSVNTPDIVNWTNSICVITKLKEFANLVLPKIVKIKSFENFRRILKFFNVKTRKSAKGFIINFNTNKDDWIYSKRINKFLDEIETRNEKLCQTIKRVQEKLHLTITANQEAQKILKHTSSLPISSEILHKFIKNS